MVRFLLEFPPPSGRFVERDSLRRRDSGKNATSKVQDCREAGQPKQLVILLAAAPVRGTVTALLAPSLSRRETAMTPIRTILYPTDFSPYSNQAYFHAVGLAEAHGASLTVVHVLPSGSMDSGYWRDQLEQVRPGNPRIPVLHELLEGDPATEISRYSAEARIDLIVIGTHGRTGEERLRMGSVAEKVVRDAPCSVLVVKLPKRTAFPVPTPDAVVTV